ncbi:hypothetical protein Tco_0188241 [Tanacetum coccineum]
MQMLDVGRPYMPLCLQMKLIRKVIRLLALLGRSGAATNDYYTRYRRLHRIVAWSSKNKFYRNMLKPFLHGQLPVERLIPDEIEARSPWWVSSRAYFDGRNIKDVRIPRHLNRNNYVEV